MIPPDDSNPYAAPTAKVTVPRRKRGDARLATLMQRFVGAMVDGMLGVVIAVVAFIIDPNLIEFLTDSDLGFEGEMTTAGIGVLAVGMSALVILQATLLATRSQSIGKIVAKTRIDRLDGRGRAGWVNTILIRWWVVGLIGWIPLIGSIFGLVDIIMIFNRDRRCLHDMMASTVVNRAD